MRYLNPAQAFLTMEEIYEAQCQRAVRMAQSEKANPKSVELVGNELTRFHSSLNTLEYLKDDRIGSKASEIITALRTKDPELGGVMLLIRFKEGNTNYGYDCIDL